MISYDKTCQAYHTQPRPSNLFRVEEAAPLLTKAKLAGEGGLDRASGAFSNDEAQSPALRVHLETLLQPPRHAVHSILMSKVVLKFNMIRYKCLEGHCANFQMG